MSLQEIIKERKFALNLKSKDLADATGLSKTSINRLENGVTKSIKPDKLSLLADILQVSPEYILTGGKVESVDDHDFGVKVPEYFEEVKLIIPFLERLGYKFSLEPVEDSISQELVFIIKDNNKKREISFDLIEVLELVQTIETIIKLQIDLKIQRQRREEDFKNIDKL